MVLAFWFFINLISWMVQPKLTCVPKVMEDRDVICVFLFHYLWISHVRLESLSIDRQVLTLQSPTTSQKAVFAFAFWGEVVESDSWSNLHYFWG